MRTLYVYNNGLVVRKSDKSIVVTDGSGTVAQEPVHALSSIVIMGSSQITEQAVKFAADSGIDIIHANRNGRIYAITNAFSDKGPIIKMTQYAVYLDTAKRLRVAKHVVKRKLEAQERYLKHRRVLPFGERHAYRSFMRQLELCETVNQVLGVEGSAAQFYYKKLNLFSLFTKRSKRPAADMINALMNLTYSMILHRICCALVGKSLDIQIGYLHAHTGRRPSLALDLLELFRPQADAFVITMTNRKEFTEKDFVPGEDGSGLYLSKQAFNRYLKKLNDHLMPELEIEKEAAKLTALLLEEGANGEATA